MTRPALRTGEAGRAPRSDHRSRRRRLVVPVIAAASVAVLAVSAVPAYAATPTGKIVGVVKTADTGKPVSGGSVLLWDLGGQGGYPTAVRATTTASDGTYTLDLTGLRAGRFDIAAGPRYGSAYSQTERAISGTVTAKSKLHQDFSVVRSGKMSGKLTPAPGDGEYPRVRLVATGAERASDGALFSVAADGTWSTPDGISPGGYKVQFVASQGTGLANRFAGGAYDVAGASTVTVRSGSTTTGVDGSLVAGGTVSGTVRASDTGAPLGDVGVELRSTDGTSNDYNSWGAGHQGQTGADGRYAFTGVSPGTYTIHYETESIDITAPDSGSALYVAQYLGGHFPSAATQVAVTAATNRDDAVSLQRGQRITGTLTAAKSSYFDVEAYAKDPTTGKWEPVATKSVYQGTSKSSSYSIPGLAPGSYKVGYRDNSTTATLPDSYYKEKSTLADGSTVTVGASGATKVDQTIRYAFLTVPTPTVSGTVKVGSTLTAKPGTWSPTPTKYTYQWKRAGVAISGATGATRKLNSYDRGKAITVTVTATRSGYTTTSVTSKAVTPKS